MATRRPREDRVGLNDQVRQIDTFSYVSTLLKSFQRREQLATWLFDQRLIHLHRKSLFFTKFKAPSTRIRFHSVFIETTNFSLNFHLASTQERSKTMIVFAENNNFGKRSSKWKNLKTILL